MRIVMTGATGGIGMEAARALVARGAEVVAGVRSTSAAAPVEVRTVPLDLSDLDGVRAFAAEVGREPIDALIGNAGVQLTSLKRSRQGYELTFAINHLAHYLLVRSLLPSMASNGRVILTSSGTHDPAMKTGIPGPRHAEADLLAHPERDPRVDAKPGVAGRRAYSSSKLCNLMTVRELARRTAADRPDLTLLAFDPGFVPGTGLARDYGAVLDTVFRRMLPLVVRGEGVSRAPVSGRALADLATEPRYAGGRAAYWSMRRRIPVEWRPSALARDDAACAKLWDDSARLVGLEG